MVNIHFRSVIAIAAASLAITSLSSCAQNDSRDKYELPDIIFGEPDYDDPNYEVFHPTNALENIRVRPLDDCEKENLRKYVIAINMYSEEYFNQSYFIKNNSAGAAILMESFPSLSKLEQYENGSMIRIDQISSILRSFKFHCDQ